MGLCRIWGLLAPVDMATSVKGVTTHTKSPGLLTLAKYNKLFLLQHLGPYRSFLKRDSKNPSRLCQFQR
ncbi:hypothetical protein Y1Q_0004571 [Alligator mississippiensis]|uniref:Uncharacterized protein n=1 Tax=Alligator mississippiensis TaxID=8496 RepID=A0A151MHJ3_ALLMI|nr:hypothetical protein Y1Q_0004571 [Alligator mississippiensis]